MCARWSPVLLSGDGHTSVRGRREAPRDEAGLSWQLLLQLLCIFQFQVQRRAAIREPALLLAGLPSARARARAAARGGAARSRLARACHRKPAFCAGFRAAFCAFCAGSS